MWEPQPLTPLWAFTACYRDSFYLKSYIRVVKYTINYRGTRKGREKEKGKEETQERGRGEERDRGRINVYNGEIKLKKIRKEEIKKTVKQKECKNLKQKQFLKIQKGRRKKDENKAGSFREELII
jgi:hypothetical protein